MTVDAAEGVGVVVVRLGGQIGKALVQHRLGGCHLHGQSANPGDCNMFMVEEWCFCGVHLEPVDPECYFGDGVGVMDGIGSICT